MHLVKITLSILLSLTLAFKHKINDTIGNFAFTSDTFLVPLSAGLLGYILCKKDKNSEFLFLGMVSNFLYYIQIFLGITGMNGSSTKLGLLCKSIIYVYTVIFRYFLSETFDKKKMIYFTFCIVFVSFNVFTNMIINDDVFSCFLKTIMSVQIEAVYITMANILCNEYGIFNFLKYSFFVPIFSLISSMFFINYNSIVEEIEFYKKNLFMCVLYYLCSALCFLGGIVLCQMYGIVCAAITMVNSMLFYMFINGDKWYISIIYVFLSFGMIIN